MRTTVILNTKEKMMSLYNALIKDPQRQAFNMMCAEYKLYIVAYNTKNYPNI